MKKICSFAILLLIFSCNKKKQVITKWDNGRNKMILTYYNSDDTLTYLKEDFYENGNAYSKGNYVNGKKEGKREWWYYDGVKKDEAMFHLGNYVSYRKHWYENGNLKQIEIITGGSFDSCSCHDGHVTNYYENGQVEDESIYFNGHRDSQYVYRYDNGQVKKQEYFKADLKEGSYKEWYRNGSKWVEGFL